MATSVVEGAGASAAFRAASMRARMFARFCAVGEAVGGGEDIALADSLARTQMARAAAPFRRAARSPLPALVLLTDDERLPEPEQAIRALPHGSLIVLRARDEARRAALAQRVSVLARERGLLWIVADDAALAARARAHGVHFPERKIALAARWRVRRPRWLITCSAHSLQGCVRAARAGADAVLLSPVFPTGSHPGQTYFGGVRTRLVARLAPTPVYALGGINAATARCLSGAPLAGLAAITGLDPQSVRTAGRCAPAGTTL